MTNQTIKEMIAQFLFLTKLANVKDKVVIIIGIKLIAFILH